MAGLITVREIELNIWRRAP